MNSKGRRSNKSICEKSMKMVANIVKLSPLFIAKMSLGTTAVPSTSNRSLSSFSGPVKVSNTPPQEPKSSSRPVISYLIEPTEGHYKSSYTIPIHEELTSVDGRASDFIRRVHEKIRYDSGEAASNPHHVY